MNFVTDLSLSMRYFNETYNAIWIMMNHFTKMTHYVSVCKTIDAFTLIRLFVQEIICLHKLLNLIVSDQETMFIFKFWFFFCFYLNIQRRLSIVFHSQTDEQTEQQNQTMKVYLQVYCNKTQNNWTKLLLINEFLYNNSKHTVI